MNLFEDLVYGCIVALAWVIAGVVWLAPRVAVVLIALLLLYWIL